MTNKKSEEELIKKIMEELPTESSLEDCEFIVVDGIKYGAKLEERLTTEDEGKYQYGGTVYAIGYLDEDKGYDIKGEPLFYVEQDFSQCGSYFDYQEICYEAPYLVEKRLVTKYEWFSI